MTQSACTLLLLLAGIAALLVVVVLVSGAISSHKRGFGNGGADAGSPAPAPTQAQALQQQQQQQQPPQPVGCPSGFAPGPTPPLPAAGSIRGHLGQRLPPRSSRPPGEVLRAEDAGGPDNSRDPMGRLGSAPLTRISPRFAQIGSELSALSKRGTVHDINASQLESLSGKNGWEGVLMVFSPGCGHCHSMMSDYEKAASSSGAVPFYRLNGDKNASVTNKYNIKGYPTIIRFSGQAFSEYPPKGGGYKGDRSYADLKKFGAKH